MKAVAAILAGLVLASCAPRLGGGPSRDCAGTAIATVRNNWNRAVDVYAEVERRSDWLLGEVLVGERREFTLPEGTTRLMYRWRSAYTGIPPTAADIAVSYSCQ